MNCRIVETSSFMAKRMVKLMYFTPQNGVFDLKMVDFWIPASVKSVWGASWTASSILPDTDLWLNRDALQAPFQDVCAAPELKGTVLLSTEGINFS